jgi:concentrative nucleoside transporter, CNT family
VDNRSRETEGIVHVLWRIDDIVALLDGAFLLSKDRRAINPHPVFGALAIQVAFDVSVLYWEARKRMLQEVSNPMQAIVDSSVAFGISVP